MSLVEMINREVCFFFFFIKMKQYFRCCVEIVRRFIWGDSHYVNGNNTRQAGLVSEPMPVNDTWGTEMRNRVENNLMGTW